MKPIREKIARPENESFFFRDLEQAYFSTPWHFHPEIEIILIVNEMRIGSASKLLIENNLSISQICYESGFNHLSNFNRQFKKIKNMTPSEYQRKYWSKSLDQINDL